MTSAPPRPDLPNRAREILYHVVLEYVSAGEPVGSRTLSKKSAIGLSPASIRNVLADLEELGYLVQPHASAGRIPTDRAFRLFIDALMKVRSLTDVERARIQAQVSSSSMGLIGARETVSFLSELAGTVAVAVAPRQEALTVRTVRFVRTGPLELLAVVVMSNGTVQNRFLHRAAVSDEDIAKVQMFLDDIIEGRSLRELRELFARRLNSEAVRADPFRLLVHELGSAALGADEPTETEVVIAGQSKLYEMPDFSDPRGLKEVVAALGETGQLAQLLDPSTIGAGVRVVVGREAGDIGGGHIALVTATYGDPHHPSGTIGVIGPTRMDYPGVVPLVEATADALSSVIARSQRDESRSSLPHSDDD
jgi:heat-inducible transcriptional repressor